MPRRRLAFSLATLLAFPGIASADDDPNGRLARPGEPYFVMGGGGHVGLFRFRDWHGKGTQGGVELGGGQAVLTHAGIFHSGFVHGSQVRIFGSHGVALSDYYEGLAGFRVGPFVPEVRAGVSGLTLDVYRGGLSAELFSPRASAALLVQLGPHASVGAVGYGEYLWRWFGPDVRIYGAGLELRVEGPRYFLDLP